MSRGHQKKPAQRPIGPPLIATGCRPRAAAKDPPRHRAHSIGNNEQEPPGHRSGRGRTEHPDEKVKAQEIPAARRGKAITAAITAGTAPVTTAAAVGLGKQGGPRPSKTRRTQTTGGEVDAYAHAAHQPRKRTP
ncbi:hypothetical protein JM654_18740 [Microbacterium oxydans]|nr:hypothetical protein [Microbacterium oxydans]